MSAHRYKYPRTPHLSFSPGVSSDDLKLERDRLFVDREVVVTEKLDGENTTIYPDYIHARSIDSRHHPSRAWVKALQARVGSDIPDGWRICGENVYAKHAIAYENLTSYFYLFSVWNEENCCLSWAETQEWAELWSLELPRVIYQGFWNASKIKAIADSLDPNTCEGLVVRSSSQFPYQNFAENVAKWVRPNHVQTDIHWMYREVIPNQLIKNGDR